MSEINFTEMVAVGLKRHCEYLGHNDIEKLKENSSISNFYRLFCKITSTYFINDGNEQYDFGDSVEHYNVTFNKKENRVYVKRCGKDFAKRDFDAVIKVEDVIELLAR